MTGLNTIYTYIDICFDGSERNRFQLYNTSGWNLNGEHQISKNGDHSTSVESKVAVMIPPTERTNRKGGFRKKWGWQKTSTFEP